MDIRDPKIIKGFDWLKKNDGRNFLLKEDHCATRDIFQARLDRMRRDMKKTSHFQNLYALVTALTGEFGNNAFDHNLGNWRDEMGVYFVCDFEKRFFVIADRGHGVLSTLLHVKPDLKNELEAVRIAFTESISGRALEGRGNGLKFVDAVAKNQKFDLFFQSGNAAYQIKEGLSSVGDSKESLYGVIAILFF